MMLLCIFYFHVWFLWITSLPGYVKGDSICQQAPELPLTYCYGITAYCCKKSPGECCWDEIWKVWWFWIVVLVMAILIASCCSFYCNNSPRGGQCDVFRRNSLDMFQRFRRFSSRDYSSSNDEWKPPPEAVLPPYSSVSPIVTETMGTTTEQSQTDNTTHSASPPPSYAAAVSETQTLSETTSLLPPLEQTSTS